MSANRALPRASGSLPVGEPLGEFRGLLRVLVVNTVFDLAVALGITERADVGERTAHNLIAVDGAGYLEDFREIPERCPIRGVAFHLWPFMSSELSPSGLGLGRIECWCRCTRRSSVRLIATARVSTPLPVRVRIGRGVRAGINPSCGRITRVKTALLEVGLVIGFAPILKVF